MAIKLFNKGGRTIINGDFHFKPQQLASFTQEAGNKILRLYPDEVMVVNEEKPTAPAETEASETDVIESVVEVEESVEEKPTTKPAKSGKK